MTLHTTKITLPHFLPLRSFLAYATGDEKILTRKGNGFNILNRQKPADFPRLKSRFELALQRRADALPPRP